jgi:imidazolonepropionase-like amidohydrolase
MSRRLVATAVAGVALIGSCAGATELASEQDVSIIRAPATIALRDVRVVPMTSEQRLDHQTVVVRDGRIESITPNETATIPTDAIVVEGRGRFLMPALIDMHVHLRRADLPAYLRYGIATVRNMWGHDGIPSMMRDVETGTIDGPTIHSTSNGFDGSPPQWPQTRLVLDAADAERAVAEALASGWSVLKVYQRLSAAVYDSIVQSAKRHGVQFVGHVPGEVSVLHALASGQRSIEHLSGYDRAVTRRGGTGTFAWTDVDQAKFAELARATVDAGTWNCPTMAILVQLSQQHSPDERAAIIQNRRRFLAELARQRARLLVGTDAGIDVVSPGVSIHDELREFVAAGLTPFQALQAATLHAAEFLGAPQLGTIAPGAPAELLLLDGDPLANIENARRIGGLVIRGSWFSVAELEKRASRRP